MPADNMEKSSGSPVAATPANLITTPDKPKTATEHRKVNILHSQMEAALGENQCDTQLAKCKIVNLIFIISQVI